MVVSWSGYAWITQLYFSMARLVGSPTPSSATHPRFPIRSSATKGGDKMNGVVRPDYVIEIADHLPGHRDADVFAEPALLVDDPKDPSLGRIHLVTTTRAADDCSPGWFVGPPDPHRDPRSVGYPANCGHLRYP